MRSIYMPVIGTHLDRHPPQYRTLFIRSGFPAQHGICRRAPSVADDPNPRTGHWTEWLGRGHSDLPADCPAIRSLASFDKLPTARVPRVGSERPHHGGAVGALVGPDFAMLAQGLAVAMPPAGFCLCAGRIWLRVRVVFARWALVEVRGTAVAFGAESPPQAELCDKELPPRAVASFCFHKNMSNSLIQPTPRLRLVVPDEGRSPEYSPRARTQCLH